MLARVYTRIAALDRLPPAAMLLGLLLSADLAFIAIHVVYSLSTLLRDPLYSLEADRGYPELFQYIKLYWLVLLCLLLAVRQRAGMYVAWAALFGLLLLDDAFRLHEIYGSWVAGRLSLPPTLGLRSGDVGELIVVAVAGAAIVVLFALGYLRAGREPRRFTRSLLVLMAALAFFAVALDAAGSILRDSAAGAVLHTLEDAGELVVVSLLVALVFSHVQPRPQAAAVEHRQDVTT